ncbi:hypothetical protein VXE65_32830 [Mycolicibacterium conceptionense]|uniref:hypothetical protein n=1 Tax=Mycolicibacterium conceptionense TaxID=451644 RepID=UPI003204CEB9
MTTYASPPVQPATQYGVPPAPPQPGDVWPFVPPPGRGDRGILAATSAFIIATSAAIATAIVLAHPVKPAEHTVTVEPPSNVTYSSSEIQSAKAAACSAWDKAARATAIASKASAAALELEPNSQALGSAAALAAEKRTGVSAVSYLRSAIGPATPSEVAAPLEHWIAASIDELHAMNQRDWNEADRARERVNNLVDVILPGCGLR